jgi:NADH-quinone oxidoreductase subunit F
MRNVGWMRPGKIFKGRRPRGSSMPCVTAQEVEEVNLDYEFIASKGSLLGSGGMIVIATTRHAWSGRSRISPAFYSHESCGQCSPCRERHGLVVQ